MSLYDGHKLDNSTYISQYVGNVIPELKEYSNAVKARYNEAANTDDSLLEAMGNMQHLDTEEDTTYANELKQKYVTGLKERATRGDYENMSRRTKRDAQKFSSEYVPLVNRLKGMQNIKERVLQDTSIFSPETKNKILGKIQHMNRAGRDQFGNLIRDESGRVALGAIQDWAYAKDVDIDKRNAEILKELEATERQTGYSTSPDGKLLQSTKTAKRTPAELAILAKQRMENDPEIKAMIERDVELSTYQLTPEQITGIAQKGNVSKYEELKRYGNSESQIRTYANAHGISMDALKTRPVDYLRNNYKTQGRSQAEADRDYVRNKVRNQIIEPHINFISNLLKIDKMELDAKVDPDYEARAAAVANAATNLGSVNTLSIATDDSIENISVDKIHNTAVDARNQLEGNRPALESAVASVLGLPAPTTKTAGEYKNTVNGYLNDRVKQDALIIKLKNEGKEQAAQNMIVAFRGWNAANNTANVAQDKLQKIYDAVDVMSLYREYRQESLSKTNSAVGLGEFKRMLTSPEELVNTGKSSTEYLAQFNPMIAASTNNKASILAKAKQKYLTTVEKMMQEDGSAVKKALQTSSTIFEPSTSGYFKQQTDFIERGLKDNTIPGIVMSTGLPLKEVIDKELSGIFTKVSDSDRANPDSDYNKKLSRLTARINADTRGANGEATATVTLPSGKKLTVILPNVSKSLPTEMSAGLLQNSGKLLTETEAKYNLQTAVQGAGWSQITDMTPGELYNALPSATPYKLNDEFYVKVTEAGLDKKKIPLYTLMYKDTNGKYVKTQLVNKESPLDIVNALGKEGMKNVMRTSPTTNITD